MKDVIFELLINCYMNNEIKGDAAEKKIFAHGGCKKYQSRLNILYVQVTVHRDKLRTKQPTRCIKYSKFILS